jgi:hypothetical protein
MSTEELTVIPTPLIPNGYYRFKFGSSTGLRFSGLFLTAGPPGTQATAAAYRPIPGRTQKVRAYTPYSCPKSLISDECQFLVTYDARTGSYLLKTPPKYPRNGLTYQQPKPGQAITTSKTAQPHEFKITRVRLAAAAEEEAEASGLPPVKPALYMSVQMILLCSCH